jgi:hypothetical protein
MLFAFLFSVLAATNTKRPLVLRILPTVLCGPLISLNNHKVGNYGVHRNVDRLLLILQQSDGELSKETRVFLDKLKQ